MEKNNIKIELPPDVARGQYANLAMIAHSPNEFVLDFISVLPKVSQGLVQSRIIMTPENAKRLMAALIDNVNRYEATFGEIKLRVPGNPGPEDPTPFMMGGEA